MIFGIFVIVAVLTTASATKKGDDSLLKELKDVFRHENSELREQDTKLQREDDQLRKRVEELQRQNVRMREEKFQDEMARMKKENKRLQNENKKQRVEIEKLRHADRRQRDQIDSLALEQKIKDVIRQEDVVLETKKREAQTNDTSRMRDALSEVDITGGSASSTSFASSSFKPDYAFVRGNGHYGWGSGTDAKNKGIFPQMVWYDFGQGNAFVPARVSFRGHMNCNNCQKYTPSVWEFVGSNNDVCSGSGNWTVLCQDLSDDIPQDDVETKFCDVNNSNQSVEQKEYRCLGINVIRAHKTYAVLSNVRMWKNGIQMGGMKNATQFSQKKV